MKYQMTIEQQFEYIKINYYSKSFPSLNYLQKRLTKFLKIGIIKRETINEYNGRKPRYIYMLTPKSKEYLPEIADLKNTKNIFSINRDNLDKDKILTDFMIYFEKEITRAGYEFSYWFKYRDIMFNVIDEEVISPIGCMILRNDSDKYKLIFLEIDNSLNNSDIYRKNLSYRKTLDSYNLLTYNSRFNLNDLPIDIDSSELIYIIKEETRISLLKKYYKENNMTFKCHFIQKEKKYNPKDLQFCLKS